MKQYDVVALGELLIDFTETGMSPHGNPLLEVNPGGAPCNVLAMLNNLGRRCAFLGKVGKDSFGDLLIETVRERGIETKGLLQDPDVHTTLAFVHTLPDGDREFSFYRKPGADVSLSENELKEEMIGDCRIFHFGSLSLTDEPCRTATQTALNLAKDAGALISFDPNLREPLWNSLDEAHEQIDFGMSQCDVMKIADNEVQWFTGKEDFDEGIADLQARHGIPLILLSKGRDGSSAYYKGRRIDAAPFLQENTIETTGAGDTFCACVLNGLLDHDIHDLQAGDLEEILRFANAAASLITTKKGALRVMPTLEEVDLLLSSR